MHATARIAGRSIATSVSPGAGAYAWARSSFAPRRRAQLLRPPLSVACQQAAVTRRMMHSSSSALAQPVPEKAANASRIDSNAPPLPRHAATKKKGSHKPIAPSPKASTAAPKQAAPTKGFTTKSTPSRSTIAKASSTRSSVQAKASAAQVASVQAQAQASPPAQAAPSSPPAAAPKPTLYSRAVALFATARHIFRFYFRGVKQIWTDRGRVRAIRARIAEQEAKAAAEGKQVPEGISWVESWTVRTYHGDLSRLPLFILALVILEEIIPFIVIYAPSLLPSTCLLPSQRSAMLMGFEVRRADALERLKKAGGLERRVELENLDKAKLVELANIFSFSTLSASVLPASLLRTRLNRRLAFLDEDDVLLARTLPADDMTEHMLQVACAERGLRASHIPTRSMRNALQGYLTARRSSASPFALPLSLYDGSDMHILRAAAQEENGRSVFEKAKEVGVNVARFEEERLEREKAAEGEKDVSQR